MIQSTAGTQQIQFIRVGRALASFLDVGLKNFVHYSLFYKDVSLL
jgi:hypothetical protein